jgi:hypothetical protein
MNVRAIRGDRHIWAPRDGRYEMRAFDRIPSASGRQRLQRFNRWCRKDLATFLEAEELALKFTLRDRDFNQGSGPWFIGLIQQARLNKFRGRHQRRHRKSQT